MEGVDARSGATIVDGGSEKCGWLLLNDDDVVVV